MSVTTAVVVLMVVGSVAYLFYRLMRWARGRTRGAYVLGAVLTDVTQAAVVHEAKQGKKGEEGDTGDPPSDE